jgi:hypothetical protein
MALTSARAAAALMRRMIVRALADAIGRTDSRSCAAAKRHAAPFMADQATSRASPGLANAACRHDIDADYM